MDNHPNPNQEPPASSKCSLLALLYRPKPNQEPPASSKYPLLALLYRHSLSPFFFVIKQMILVKHVDFIHLNWIIKTHSQEPLAFVKDKMTI